MFLFDGLLILCKPNMRRTSVTSSVADFRLKEKFMMRKLEVNDIEDTEDLKNAFSITVKGEIKEWSVS